MSFLIRLPGAPNLGLDELRAKLPPQATPLFRDKMLPALVMMAGKYQLGDAGVVSLSGHETGWGMFTRAVKPEMHNPCGLKWHDPWRRQLVQLPEQGEHTLSHAAFPNWLCGCDALCQHVLAYMGIDLPPWQVKTDPRFDLALAKARAVGGAVYWSDMRNGIWSTGANYGLAIETIMRKTFLLAD